MDIRSLRYFIETARLNSFTRAAETLNVTQSTISKMVRQLESELDAQLLVRDGRKLGLTDTGRIVFERGQEILATMRHLSLEVEGVRSLQRGRLAVGIPPMINLLCTPVLKGFRARYPDIELVLQEDAGQAVERQVAAGNLEIGMTVMPSDPDLDLVSLPMASYPIWALARSGTFPKRRSTLPLKALRDMPLVMLKDEFALTRSLRRAFREVGLDPKIAAESGQWDWLVAMASAGLGVALLPEPFIQRLVNERVEAVRIVEPEISWQVAQIWNGRYLSHAASAWLQVCRDVLGTPGR